MTIQRQTRQLGDTRIPIRGTLEDSLGVPQNLVGVTVTFKMLGSEGSTKVAETTAHVTVTDAMNGQVEYAPRAADVDTEGTFHAYFVGVGPSGLRTAYPAKQGGFEIVIQAPA